MMTVILVGGASRRMGSDKALLPFRGTTLLQYQINRYAALGPVAVSVNHVGKYPISGVLELVDRWPDCGPLNGLVSAFNETNENAVFLTAVDLPYGDPALALRLAEMRGNADACILQTGEKGFEPLFAVYGRPCGYAAERALAAGHKSVRAIVDELKIRYVTPEEVPEYDLDWIMTNVNTPEDYRLLKN